MPSNLMKDIEIVELKKNGPVLSMNNSGLAVGEEILGGTAINKNYLCFTKSKDACKICRQSGHAAKDECEIDVE